jgi:putative membrane protein
MNNMNEFFNAKPIIASLIFAAIGILVLVFSFWVVDRLTPHNLWKEIIEKGNVALAILAGSFLLAIGLIVSAAIHG